MKTYLILTIKILQIILKKAKKYLIRVKTKKPCKINFIRNNNSNKIHCLGEKKEDNINYCKGNNKYEYTKEENKKNNYKHEQAIKETLESANLIEKILNEQTCCRKFGKITPNEIILHGIQPLKMIFNIK